MDQEKFIIDVLFLCLVFGFVVLYAAVGWLCNDYKDDQHDQEIYSNKNS